ncbi:MAG: hypothetical protein LBH53_00610 [Puniceicoccales bacterium]|jgi:hypothetical protein|nr:hypothetical protein [Puniceicoccales bacterium]
MITEPGERAAFANIPRNITILSIEEVTQLLPQVPSNIVTNILISCRRLLGWQITLIRWMEWLSLGGSAIGTGGIIVVKSIFPENTRLPWLLGLVGSAVGMLPTLVSKWADSAKKYNREDVENAITTMQLGTLHPELLGIVIIRVSSYMEERRRVAKTEV